MTVGHRGAGRPGWRRAVFAGALSLSAFLLFLIQPLTGRLVLPVLGGSATVWTTCLVFFQALLLAAYAWAHVTSRLTIAAQIVLHVTVLATIVCWLPIATPLQQAQGEPTVSGLAQTLFRAVGLPVFIIGVNAPVLQRWFTATGDASRGDPYFLYAFSNIGSFAGLLIYPLLAEPLLTLTQQRVVWSAGYGVLVVLVGACGLPLLRGSTSPTGNRVIGPLTPAADRRLSWLLLSLVPSSLMAGVTAYLSTELAPVPLLWVVPLGIYLLTFVTSFAGHILRVDSLAVRLLPLFALPFIGWHLAGSAPVWSGILLHLVLFSTVAALCHGRLALTRPHAGKLTVFYLWVALGGVMGGLVNAVVAPAVFRTAAEYPLMLVVAAVVIQGFGRGMMMWSIACLVTAGWIVWSKAPNATAAALPFTAALAFSRLRPGFRTVVATLVVATVFRIGWSEREHRAYVSRSIFATLRVVDDWQPGMRALIHGTTVHGVQVISSDGRREPQTYYASHGPAGQLFSAVKARLGGARIGLVGLGAGELAAYGQRGQQWTFYEIDPEVIGVAQNPALFTYLSDSAADVDVVLADGRAGLTRDTGPPFAVLVLDAFTSDAIPMHLLTREAFSLYRRKLRNDGLLAFHVSNRFVDLRPVIAGLSHAAGQVALGRFDPAPAGSGSHRFPSHWVVVGNAAALPPALTADARWARLPPSSAFAGWRDEWCPLLRVFKWRALIGAGR